MLAGNESAVGDGIVPQQFLRNPPVSHLLPFAFAYVAVHLVAVFPKHEEQDLFEAVVHIELLVVAHFHWHCLWTAL